jgi:Tol biopolymer transport system component
LRTAQLGDERPIWSPNGNELVYAAGRPTNLFRRPVSGQHADVSLIASSQPKAPTDWSRDGRLVLYRSHDPETGWDLWVRPLDPAQESIEAVRTRFDERDGQFSPDAKWIAYQSNESGRFEIYVRPFGRPGDKATISNSGGAQVRWRADGKELFYVAFDNRLIAVPIELAPDGGAIDIGRPLPLFSTRIVGAVQGANRQQYIVSADGQRFLMNTLVEGISSPLVVLLNWKPARLGRTAAGSQ